MAENRNDAWTAGRVANDAKNLGANVLWGAKDWGDAGRNLGGAFSGKDTEGKSLGIWDRVKKGVAGVGDATLGALSVASTASLAIPVVGEAAKAGTVALQGAKAAKAGVEGVKAAEAVKGGTAAASGLKPSLKGPQFKKPGEGDWNPYRPVKPNQGPLNPLPGGGSSSAAKGGTTVVEAPSSTRPDFNPLRDTKPFDPMDNPKTNPWPGMPKIEPKPAAPKPAPAPAPKPAEPKPKTSTPWQPKSTVKPDAAQSKPKAVTSTETAPETKPATEPSNNVGRKVAFGTGVAAAAGLAMFMPKPKTGNDKPWNPSAIV
jgi:hypothetical protein